MGNLEKPLTWGLTILLLGYLFAANCKCGEESACSLNNGFNISNAGLNNGFNISSADLNNGFNISNAGLNGDLKFDAPTFEEWIEAVNALDEDGDTTVVTETNIDSTEVEIEEE